MNLVTEMLEENPRVIIIAKKEFSFVELLKSELKKYGAEIFFSSRMPKSPTKFDYYFSIESLSENKIRIKAFKQNFKDLKIINIRGANLRVTDIDKILWFTFSKTKESILTLTVPLSSPKDYSTTSSKLASQLRHFLTKKNIFLSVVFLIIFSHVIFIPPLLTSLYFVYAATNYLRKEEFNKVNNNLFLSWTFLQLSKKLYSFSQPTFLLFSQALLPDNLIDVDEKTNITLQQSLAALQNVKEIEKLIFKKDKTSTERQLVSMRIGKLKEEVNTIEENITLLNQKIPPQFLSFQKFKNQLSDATDSIDKLKKILSYSDILLAKDTEKKYLLFFANNMEIRPGGGFIGSFGIVRVKDYTIDDIQIYDVYDADGQLTAHIEPPEPIKEYLNMPHWFLRDSNFSPDFLENYSKAKFFLEKELNLNDFSGSFLITTTAIENLLGAFGDVNIPDFNETVNQKNFYLKAQIHSEKDFFPGSIQKKTFLGALTRQILINMETVSMKTILQAIKTSLDEKQMVVYFDEPKIQEVVNSFYWSGMVIEPKCSSQVQNCIIDYLFPYDANVGANKVNFFINRSLDLKTDIDQQGNIHHLLSIQFRNESPSEAFPGGTYHNYFQMLLPYRSSIKQITKDGTLVENFNERVGQYKTVSFYFEVEPKRTVEIKIDYQLNEAIVKGKGVYQLVIQKQIGSPNTDFVLEINLAKNVYLLNQNFSPLVKNNSIIYNTSLSADKIFFMELAKE